ncbi:MAG TPA: zf-HC2 domain-containing protein [Candidatus Acidoferrales bacterium]|nr:zf-HC2 domain-containing protein [Candidatus Acidoferrales bacterium]
MNATTPMNPASHVDEVTGLLYIEGQLEPAAAREVVAHLEHCATCRRLLDTLKRESLLLRAALTEQDEPLPARLLEPRAAEGISWGWLVALGLAALGLYTFWNLYVDPWLESLNQSGFDGQFVFTWLVFNGALWKGWNAMLQFIILGSLGVLGAVLLFLFRRSLRRFSSFSLFVPVLLLAALAWPTEAHATEFVRRHGSYDVPEGQTVHGDLYVLATQMRMAGTVEGDLFCFCSSLDVDGHVTGDVFAFSHAVRMTGKVDGSLRTFNGDLTIEGEVGRNVMSFVGILQSTQRSHINGSVALVVGDLQLDGPIGRDLTAVVGRGELNAPIGGDAWLRQAQQEDEWHMGPRSDETPIQVTPRADIKGSFRYRGPLKPEISPQAHLAGGQEIDIREWVPAYRRPMSYWYNAMIWGMALIVGLVLIALFPGTIQESAQQVGRVGASLALGLVVFFMLPIAGILACITVVGLGLGITMVFCWVFLSFFGQIIPAIWIGESVLGRSPGTWSVAGRLALGLFLIRLGALLPYLGVWVRMGSAVVGCGALALVLYRRYEPPAAHAPAAPAPAAAAD